MTQPSTDRLGEVKARAEAATPGPWISDGDAYSWTEDDGYATSWVDNDAGRWVGPHPATGAAMVQANADAAFIAHALADIDWLISEVSRLREVIAAHVGPDPDEHYDCRTCHNTTACDLPNALLKPAPTMNEREERV